MCGALLRDAGLDRDAAPLFGRAAASYESLDVPQWVFQSLNDQANCKANQGRYDTAEPIYRRCRQLAERLGDHALLAQADMNMGEMLRRAGDPDGAVSALTRSVEVADGTGDERLMADALGNLGLALVGVQRLEEADTALRQSLALARRTRNLEAEAQAHHGLGNVALMSGRYGRAAQRYRRAAAQWEALGDLDHQCQALVSLIDALAARQRPDEVDEAARRLAGLVDRTGNTMYLAEAYLVCGRWFLADGYVDAAAERLAPGIVLALARIADGQEDAGMDVLAFVARVEDQLHRYVTDEGREVFWREVRSRLTGQFGIPGNMWDEVLDAAMSPEDSVSPENAG